MKYLILILSIMLSLVFGYKYGVASSNKGIEVKARGLYILELELLEMASNALRKDTAYLQLTTINDKEKVIELIRESSLESIEKGVKILSDFSKQLSPKSQVVAAERIAASIRLVQKIKKESKNTGGEE